MADLNEQAEAMFLEMEKQMAEREGVTEQLMAQDQMLWGAGLRWRPLPKAEAPTEAAAETGAPFAPHARRFWLYKTYARYPYGQHSRV